MKKLLKQSLLLILSAGILSGSVLAATVIPTSTSSVPVTDPVSDPAPKPSIRAALAEFKNLSKKERKLRVKEAKKQLKEFKKEKRNGGHNEPDKVLLIILAILLPPLAVYLHQGEINSKFWISLLLTLLFFIPGVIYALLVVTGEID